MPRISFTPPVKQVKSYHESLSMTTRYGSLVACTFYLLFILLYWLLDYPMPMVYFNLLALIVSGLGYFALVLGKRQRLAGSLVALSVYIALIGPSVFTGGIDASSLVWLMFIPVIAAIMLGPRAIFQWLILCLLTVGGLFVANRVLGFDFTLRPPHSIDRLIDLTSALVAIGIAAWLNERVKVNAMLELERTHDKLSHMATIDQLTEAYNRRYFMDRAPAIIQNSSEGCLLIFDIDHFKEINDTHGHTAGDSVLKEIYSLCKENIREGDMLARFGGDEFVILLPHLSSERGAQTARRLCQIIATTPIHTAKGVPINVSVSVGITPYRAAHAQDVDALLHQADQAMYRAKQKGRNRVSF